VSALAPTLQAFFTDRLIRQRHASGHTIAAYRDTLRLLLEYAATRTGLPPSRLDLADLDAPLIAGFLDHLERGRGNSVRTRNARLAAIRSLFRFAALEHPEHAESISRVLAIPPKRFDRALITYLTEPEVDALLARCDQGTWTGRRDHALLLLAVQTGLRISELTGLTRRDVHLGPGAHVACHGKGRKDRITPLTSGTIAVLRNWLTEHSGDPDTPLFPTRRGTKLSRDAIEHRLAHYTVQATGGCPSLHGKTITAHVLRHTTAMRLLHAGVDTSVIALWLGHANIDTTQIYLHADLNLKRASAGQNPATKRPHRPIPATRQPPRLARSALIMPTSSARNPCAARKSATTSA
jgi:integrase/recombinase XerD